MYKGMDIIMDGEDYKGLSKTKHDTEGFCLRKKVVTTEDGEIGAEYDVDIEYISI